MLYVRQAGQKTSLAEQRGPAGAPEEKGAVPSPEARSGFALHEECQSCGSCMLGERPSSVRVETGQCCFR